MRCPTCHGDSASMRNWSKLEFTGLSAIPRITGGVGLGIHFLESCSNVIDSMVDLEGKDLRLLPV